MHTKAERVVEGKSSSSSSKREMALEALSSNEFLNFIIYDTISAAQYSTCCNDNTTTTTTSPDSSSNFFFDINSLKTHQQQQQQHQQQQQQQQIAAPSSSSMTHCRGGKDVDENPALIHNKLHQQQQMGMGRKKRRRRQRVCKNKEEAETQRMTHIAVERNRRKQMNEHLAVLRSLMPESYVQRGDQASIVGGAIEFVKELEHHLQSLEAQKFILLEQNKLGGGIMSEETTTGTTSSPSSHHLPFAQFFSYPQYTCSSSAQSQLANNNNNNKYMTSKSKAAVADIEVTLIETHANVRILSQRRLRQLSKLVTGFHTLYLSILHLNVTTLDPLVLYSISAKVEEGCLLNSADDIAAAVHHIIRIIEEEATTLCSQDSSL